MRERGVVKWFKNEKGYGFITPDSGGTDLFVHFSGVRGDGFRSLEGVDRVEVNRETADKGDQAIDVVVLTRTDGQEVHAEG